MVFWGWNLTSNLSSHLLITKPSKSVALETFVLERAELSTHVAMLVRLIQIIPVAKSNILLQTLFNCQALLHDLSSTPRDSPSFVICQRVLNRCYDIIFGDPAPTVAVGPYRSPAVLGRPSSKWWRQKVKPHFEPSLVGITAVLAATPGMPCIASVVGKWAIDQGRVDDDTNGRRMLDGPDHEPVSPAPSVLNLGEGAKKSSEDSDDGDLTPPTTASTDPAQTKRHTILAPSPEVDRVFNPAQTTPSLSLRVQLVKPLSTRTTDPFGQFDFVAAASSTPSIPSRPPPSRTSTAPVPILQKYDPIYQSQLLRSNYARSEVNFIRGLEAISNRLLIVPKPARVSKITPEVLF